MMVKAVDGVKNEADDNDGIVLGRLAFARIRSKALRRW